MDDSEGSGRTHTLLAIVLAALVQTPADRRAAADHGVDFSTVTIPGADFSDAAVDVSATHFCGTTDACRDMFRTSRDKLVVAYARGRGRRKAILKLIGEEREGQFVNWHTSFERYDAAYNRARSPWFGGVPFGPSVTCTTWGSGASVTTTCTSRGW